MNPAALLGLLSSLYETIQLQQQRITELEAELQQRTEPAVRSER